MKKPSNNNFPIELEPLKDAVALQFPKAWSGKVGRLRIYDDANGKRVFVFLDSNESYDYVGYSDDTNIVKAAFDALNFGAIVGGYSNNVYKIQFIDYRRNLPK